MKVYFGSPKKKVKKVVSCFKEGNKVVLVTKYKNK